MNVNDLSPQAKTCLLISYHPSRVRHGIPVTERNRPFVEEAVQAGFLELDGGRAFLTAAGMGAAQRLLDDDREARTFYFNVNKQRRNK